MSKTSFEKLQQLDLTHDEVTRIGEALKKDEFRQLLHDYVTEIQDPENRKLYEQEIIQLEKERGIDATFLNPEPGYVIKTSADGTRKCFVNICTNAHVTKPTSTPADRAGSRGLQWAIPHSLTPAREDLDRKGVRCLVYDVVFHPDTVHLAQNNAPFKDMVNNVACEAIESNFGVKLDRNNMRFPKIEYKGMPRASLIRKASNEPCVEREDPLEKELFDKIYAEADKNQSKPIKSTKKPSENTPYTTPEYLIKHRTHVDIQEFVESKEAKIHAAIPKELVVEVSLPLLKSTTDVALDVTDKTLQLTSEKPAKYKLSLTLPYHVVQDNGHATFDKDARKLIVVLPVKRDDLCFIRDDSGVDSSPPTPEEESKVTPSVITKTNDFLDSETHYSVPEFTCHLYENILAFILHVKNVDASTVDHVMTKSNLHLKFTSIGASFYGEHYAFFVALPDADIVQSDVKIDAWDNNLTLHIPFNVEENTVLTHYLFGLDETDLKSKPVDEPEVLYKLFEDSLDEESKYREPVTVEIGRGEPELSECKTGTAISISGTSCESSGDELSCSFSPSKGKGILKNRRSIGRSISESSLEDYVMVAKSLDSAIIPEMVREDEEELSASFKKTVRFNDVIKKQLYRSNSSILGQKKKNQRKARNKKRAQERRHSESETSEVDDRKDDERDETNNSNSDIFHMDMNC